MAKVTSFATPKSKLFHVSFFVLRQIILKILRHLILKVTGINQILREKKPGFKFFATLHDHTNIGIGISPDESLIISSNQSSDRFNYGFWQ